MRNKNRLTESILNNINEAEDTTKSRDYTVTVGFLGYPEGFKDYEVTATSRLDAVNQALDNEPSLAKDDIMVRKAKKDEDGAWEVEIIFGDNPIGSKVYYEDSDCTEEEAKRLALDEAIYDGDLYLAYVDGTEFDYEKGE